MTTRNNVGIFNSKAYINEYARSLRTATPKAPRPNSTVTLCDFLLEKMGEKPYSEWLATTPDDNEGFAEAVRRKLLEITLGK